MNSFRNRFLLAFLLITLLFMGLMWASHYRSLYWVAMDSFESSSRLLAEHVARQAVVPVFTENPPALAGVASEALQIPGFTCVSFFNQDQKRIFPLDPPACQPNGQVALVPARDQTQTTFRVAGAWAEVVVPVILEPLPIEGRENQPPKRVIGHVRLCLTLDGVERQMSALAWNLAWSALAVTLMFILSILFLEGWVTRPVLHLSERVRKIAAGDLAIRAEVPPTRDEIATLAQNINQMADALQGYTLNLEQMLAGKTREISVRERQLMFQEKMASLGRLSASIAHEINNPLNFISLGLDALENHERKASGVNGGPLGVQSPERQQIVAGIRKGLVRVKAIIDSLRKFSRSNEGVNLEYLWGDVFDDALQIFQGRIKASGIRLEKDFQWSGTLRGSPTRVQQILVNLFSNALDSLEEVGPSQPCIRVETGRSAGQLVVRFRDNGPGITPEHRSHLFEPFYTTKDPGKGSGLGLALCYELAAREGGRITFLEPAAGGEGGAAFELVLPLPRETPGSDGV